MREPIKFHWKDTHHLYIGFFVLIFACIRIPFTYYTFWTNMYLILGTYIVLDDIIEHSITATTPLRIFAEKILFPIIELSKKLLKINSKNIIDTEPIYEKVLLFEGPVNDPVKR